MKKVLTLIALAALVCTSLSAQENGNRDAEGNIVRGPYVQNTGFFDNSFIEIQGGVDAFNGKYMEEGGRKSAWKPGMAAGVNFGKWFNPVIGLRLGWQGTCERWFNKATDYYEHGAYNYAHADLLVNFSNWFSGYKETRIWDVIPYIHLGAPMEEHQVRQHTENVVSFGGGLGIYNTFRLAPRWHLTLDLRCTAASDKILGPTYAAGITDKQAGICYSPAALLGLSFTLGKTGWTRESTAAKANAYECIAPETVKAEQAVVLEAQDKADAAVKAVKIGTIETEEELAAAKAAVLAACGVCNETVATAQELVNKTSKKVDANGNVLPACYADVDAATADAYCKIANTEACPDFTAMTNKEINQWTKAHKAILPKDWKKMSAVEKNVWVKSNIYCPATLAKEENAFAENELAKAKARKVNEDPVLEKLNNIVIVTKPAKPEGLEAAGYFTIGKSKFNKKQKENWKESIESLGKEFDYTVTGYSDKETGSPKLNEKLRKERSEYVKDLMVEEGFTGEITTQIAGENEKFVEKPSYKNRVAVIR